MNKSRHNFTLLEILVAVAVLVIMMSFLFQFVISAQRVWAASTARTAIPSPRSHRRHFASQGASQPADRIRGNGVAFS